MADINHDLGNFNTHLGLKIVEWRENYAKVSMIADEVHMNRSGVLHGGITATLFDVAGGYACTWCSVPGNVRRAFSLSLTVNYTGQGLQGEVFAEAKVTGGGRKIKFVEVHVTNADGSPIGMGTGTYRMHKNSEDSAGFKP